MHINSIADNARSQNTSKCKISPATLYHVTLPDNYISICQRGVDPEFSQSHPGRVYFVERRCLPWAVRYISERHNFPAEYLIIFKVRTGKRVRSLGRGLWWCDHPKTAHYYHDAAVYVQ